MNSIPGGGFGATLKDTLGQGTGHGGEGEEMADGARLENDRDGCQDLTAMRQIQKGVAIADHPFVTTSENRR